MSKARERHPEPKPNGRSKSRQQRLPAGWTEQQLRDLALHYENQSEDEAVAEDEARCRAAGYSMMSVPTELVPKVAKMIARHEKSA